MNRPKFSRAQLGWLRAILTPECCHVSGVHNPTYFEEKPKMVCYLQKKEAYAKALASLGFASIPGVSALTCGWCPRKLRNGLIKRWS